MANSFGDKFEFCCILNFKQHPLFSRLQEARLLVLKKILQQREDTHAELNTKRLDKLW